jgi:polyisoprenoid-binding protein YceI
MSWTIDNAHTQIQFSVNHMMITKVRGHFEKFSGAVELDENHPANTTVNIQVETASVNTREPNRDNHLRSPDFFNSTVYPTMTFKSTQVDVSDKNHACLAGEMTIRDVTRPVVMDVEFTGMAKSPWGSVNAGFTASTRINRKDWGLTWNKSLETGGLLVGDEIEILIEPELVKQPEKEMAAQAA